LDGRSQSARFPQALNGLLLRCGASRAPCREGFSFLGVDGANPCLNSFLDALAKRPVFLFQLFLDLVNLLEQGAGRLDPARAQQQAAEVRVEEVGSESPLPLGQG